MHLFSDFPTHRPSTTGLTPAAADVLPLTTDRYRLEIHYWQQLIDDLPAIVWVSDEAGSTLFFNARWYAYTGQDSSEPRLEERLKALHPDERDVVVAHWFALVKAYKTDYAATIRLRRHDGVYRRHLCRANPLTSALGWIGFCTEVPRGAEISG